jgi:PQQ-dependent dehydrogenase (methanol/ethanol family)
MSRKAFAAAAAVPLLLALGFATAASSQSGKAKFDFGGGKVTHKRQLSADAEPGTWMSDGRTYNQQRYSPLTQINAQNIGQLGLAWYGDIDTQNGQESTPVVVDGVLYLTTAWSMVKAYDAKTGRKMWEYDPKVDRAKGRNACCDVVNRGVAVRNGKVYLGALDGRLIALDSKTGNEIWSVQTTDPERVYTITQVPQLTPNLVIIGNAGAEYDVRGYVTAYDAETGKQVWRFYTVPGDPSKPFEHEMLKEAAATWKGEWWKMGGGATAWDDILYDPETDMVYFGTGNGLAWAQELRSPGGGDNLFVSSIIALDAKTGKYKWHYQQVPGDEWDYDNTNPLMTADLVINGKKRHVLMQSPKQGFFYVMDARTGELISANQHAPQNWAKYVDLKTGRPIINEEVRYSSRGQPAIVYPAALGAHNWHPMAYSPRTGLVYIPITESITAYAAAENFEFKANSNNTGITRNAAVTALFNQPGAPRQGQQRSYIQAWDPVAGKEVWRFDNDPRVQAGQTIDPKTTPPIGYGASGILATASDLIFSGNHLGEFAAYDARNGRRLWSAPTQSRTVAAPMTYSIDGEQYVAILVGARGLPEGQGQTNPHSNTNARILVFKLDGQAKLPTAVVSYAQPGAAAAAPAAGATAAAAPAAPAGPRLNPPLFTGSNEDYLEGETAYARNCGICHGDEAVADKSIPDLRYSTALNSLTEWDNIVLKGTKVSGGMPAFPQLGEMSASIRHYVIRRANFLKDEQARAGRGG